MTDFEFQIAMWGYAVTGPADIRVRVSERPVMRGMPAWDDPELLEESRLNGNRPPEYFACYWLGEHVRRGYAPLLS